MDETGGKAVLAAEAPDGPGFAYVDGDFCGLDEAKLPLMDWGFLRSDATYDVIRVNDGRFFRIEDHLARFRRSSEALGFSLAESWPEVRRILGEVVRRSELEDCVCYAIATRGVPPLRMSRDPRDARNRLYAMAVPILRFVQPGEAERAIAVTIGPKRRIDPSSVDPTIKNFHWQDLIQSLRDAQGRQADSTILLDLAGHVTEGPGFNVFIARDGRLATPASGVLEGITRKTVFEMAGDHGIPCVEADLTPGDLRAADEVFGTTTAGGIIPIGRRDGVPFGNGGPGPITRLMRTTLAEYERSPDHSVGVGEVCAG
jgi:branched-chain amino acid aminotransferase